jgi:tRNA pseudouridine38-40 synthase
MALPKIKLVIGYDGTDFHGFARQPGLRTIQGVLEEHLARIHNQPVEVFGSGRTDAGVHARAQVVHFEREAGPPAEKYVYLLRRSLPPDIVPISAEEVPGSFHARFSVVTKTYRYTIQRAAIPDVFSHRYSWHEPTPMNVQVMQEAAAELLGEHDFTSFCASATHVEDKVRTISAVQLEERGTYLDITCSGNGFLQYMVRIIVGTLVDLGEGRLQRGITEILLAKNRTVAGRTAPARGLCLWQVDYGFLK